MTAAGGAADAKQTKPAANNKRRWAGWDKEVRLALEGTDNSEMEWSELCEVLGTRYMEQAKMNNQIKKGDLILTGAYGPPIPIVDKKLIEVNSSLFGNVSAIFK